MQTKDKTSEKTGVYLPKLYKVILLNDNKTTMDFVVEILRIIFNKTQDEAISIMLSVHKKGSGICGLYIKEIAICKQQEVLIRARNAGFPLQCKIEQE